MKVRFSDDLEAQQYSLHLRLAIYNTGKKASFYHCICSCHKLALIVVFLCDLSEE